MLDFTGRAAKQFLNVSTTFEGLVRLTFINGEITTVILIELTEKTL